MKSAKKLMLLLLSLVLLIGAFAVVALAENDADVATVVYPDGTTETYAVGESIVPKAFTDGFYEGKGNTLWQGSAWTFTVSGEASALADLKVTDAMKGGGKIQAEAVTTLPFPAEIQELLAATPKLVTYLVLAARMAGKK